MAIYSEIFEGWTRLELIQQVLRGLGSPVATRGTDTATDYSRYPKQDIIDKLVQAEIEFNKVTETVTTFAIIEGVAERSEYHLPKDCLKITDAKYYTGTNEYEQLRFVPDRRLMKEISNHWKTDVSGGNPQYLYPSYQAGNIKTFGVYPKPDTTGSTFDGSSLGVVTSTTSFTFSGDVTGTHRVGAGDNRAYVEDEAGRDFTTLGVTVGMMLFNTTDGSSGQITSITNGNATNDRLNVTLSGGTDDDFDEGDSFVATVGQYGVLIRADNSEEYVFSTAYGALNDISPLSGNILIDYVKRPLRLSTDEQKPEIPMDFQNALVEYAIWKLGSSEYNGFIMEKRAQEAKEAWFGYIGAGDSTDNAPLEDDNRVIDLASKYYDDCGDYYW
jgi:hypothetical protein